MTLQTLAHLINAGACDQVMEETANAMLKQIPEPVDVEEITNKYPVLYEQSMNTVLIQEIIRSVPVVRSPASLIFYVLRNLLVSKSAPCDIALAPVLHIVRKLLKRYFFHSFSL